jgi:hypothetical protein
MFGIEVWLRSFDTTETHYVQGVQSILSRQLTLDSISTSNEIDRAMRSIGLGPGIFYVPIGFEGFSRSLVISSWR